MAAAAHSWSHVIASPSAGELRARVLPPAQPGQLPQLQHYPAALAAGRPAECGFHTTAPQAVSHHAALQVYLWSLGLLF